MHTISKNDIKYMQRCLHIAKNGLGNVSPNPMVGCVVVYEDSIIGEGYHIKSGDAHAEVNAINAVNDKSLLEKATLYVNLEPCSHYGKTPPCADFIIKNKIPKVVIANTDTNPMVRGKGIEKLQKPGCHVTVGVLSDEARYLNRRFFTFHEKKRPYIILKWAQTKEGFLDKIRENNSVATPTWITSERTSTIVHKWRAEEDAIMIGTNTALNDNPSLTAREWKGKNPVRIVLDKTLRLSAELNIFNQQAPTIVFNTLKNETKGNLKFIKIPFGNNVPEEVLKKLFEENIQSLLIEGGAQLLSSFIEKNLWDEARVFTGNVSFVNGLKAPLIKRECKKSFILGPDRLDEYDNT